MADTTEYKTVELTANRETRTVVIWRYSPRHCWHAKDTQVLVRFRTGTKLHRLSSPSVVESGGMWRFSQQVLRNRHCSVVDWYERNATSEWIGCK